MSLNFINALFNKSGSPEESAETASAETPETLARMAWANPNLGR